jgi:HEAT repeat protein
MRKIGFLIITLGILTNYVFAEFDIKPAVKEAKKIIAAGMRSTDERVRANAVEAALVSDDTDLINDIVSLLNDQSVIVKFAAAVAVGDLNHTQSKEKLVEMTKDKNLNVVMASSYALCKMGDAQYIKKIEANAMDKNQTIRANAAYLLGKSGKQECLPLLYKIKDSSESSNTAAFNATEAIARLGDEKIYKKIWTMLISVFADDRYMGAQAMAALGGQKGADALVSMLEDEIPEVRLTAAGQLGTLGEKTGKTVVKEYLTGPVPENKEQANRCNVMAALAIGQIGEDELAGYLPKMLKSDSPYVQLAAAKSLLMLDKAR